ncbi:MAG: response regulator transcription factor [Ruminococcus sp.]|jgi:two-component system alkaline phosphatase synthesis response regulator PhoP|nr:response regulator transcription factor [Ruminococcus sp.]
MLIYTIEDEDNIRELLIYALKGAGFSAVGFSGGKDFFTEILKAETSKNSEQKSLPNLILLDIMLPGEDGISILKKLKSNSVTEKIPVIMLTAKGAEYDKIKGLDTGADDYITKPFSVMEVISRIKAVMRRVKNETVSAEIKVGRIVLNTESRSVTAAGSEIVLTYKEFELLMYLMTNKNIVLSRDKILVNLWGYDYDGGNRTVDMHIKSLRQKLGDDGDCIKTVRNIGYKINE